VAYPELKRRGKEIYFYHQPNFEIDFLIKEGLKVIQLFQASYSLESEDTRKKEIRALMKGKTIHLIPLWKWLFTLLMNKLDKAKGIRNTPGMMPIEAEDTTHLW